MPTFTPLDIKQLQVFLWGSLRAVWISIPPFEIFVRVSKRKDPQNSGSHFRTLDLANINSSSPGSGLFPSLLHEFQGAVDRDPDLHAVYIENVLNPRLANHIRQFSQDTESVLLESSRGQFDFLYAPSFYLFP